MAPNRLSLSLQSLVVLTTCVFLFGMGQFHRAAGAVVAPVWQDQFALSADQLGFVISVIFIVNIVAQGFIGTLLDKYGPRIIISLFLLILALGTLACIYANSFVGLVVARLVLGLGLSVGGVGMYMLLARNFHADQFGFLNGLMVTIGGIGGLAATYPLAFVIDRFGWTNVFIGLSIFTACLAAMVFATAQKEPKESDTAPQPKISFFSLLKNKNLHPILLMAIVTWAPITCITGLWGGPYFKAVHGLSLNETGAFQMLFFAATMTSGTVFGLIDKYTHISRYTVILTASAISVLCLAALALADALPLYVAAALLFVMIFSQQFYVPLIAQLRDVVPDAAIGRASSLYTIVAVAAIPAFQTLFGIVIQSTNTLPPETSYQYAFGGMALLILIPSLIYAVLPAAKNPV
ncbi:MFS transporter [Amylibacter sp. IMCC11727]|uniref:MFS transporter n=1 Tax=Amylibacter sp. IMCC11727 TaxID=3039851 RepID=UPI00244E2722|nr:MFS transporter [Amylibacter sp. IMCC11727]WGI21416.1 MFS transporter [Amylibacter sp. IMCC11727]